jgi:hypothetical protein
MQVMQASVAVRSVKLAATVLATTVAVLLASFVAVAVGLM